MLNLLFIKLYTEALKMKLCVNCPETLIKLLLYIVIFCVKYELLRTSIDYMKYHEYYLIILFYIFSNYLKDQEKVDNI